MRRLVSVVMTAGLLATLSACSTAPTGFADCSSSGNASLVTATGALDSDPQATFPTPLVANSISVSVASRGDGDTVPADGSVDLTLSIYYGETGEPVATQSGNITALGIRTFVDDGAFPFTDAIACASEGSRVVAAGTARQLFGEDSLGLDPATSLVVVADVDTLYLGKANGADQLAQAGYPAVVLAPNGRPGITFSLADLDGDLSSVALKQGSGATVDEGDTVVANVTGAVWGSKETFVSSWDRLAPTSLTVADLDANGNGVPPGLKEALVGQKVGSQLLVVLSGDDSYPAGSEPAGVTAGDTVVFVVDILGISS